MTIRTPVSEQVADESIRDTLMDLANYAIMTILEMDEEKGMETPDPNVCLYGDWCLLSPQ
ncbi:MAG: hypothetical protein ACLRNQ_17455 [Flavonifractor plautii]